MGNYSKVTAAGAATALTTLLVFGLQTAWPEREIPLEAGTFVAGLIGMALVYWFPANVPPKPAELPG